MPVDYIALTRAQYDELGYPPYQWAERPDTPPWTPFRAPMSESKVALIGSGGAYLSGQVAFHWKDDTGIRRIPTSEPATDIRVTHFAYDLVPAREDPNIVFPVDRLRELVDLGVIGGLAPTAIGCMGGIYSTRRTVEELAPAVVAEVLGKSVAQMALNWTIQQPGVTAAVCGAKRPDQIEENVGAADWRLSKEDLERITEIVDSR